MRCGFGPFLAPQFVVQFCQNHKCTAPHLIFAITCAVRCNLEFSQNHNCTAQQSLASICAFIFHFVVEAFGLKDFGKKHFHKCAVLC